MLKLRLCLRRLVRRARLGRLLANCAGRERGNRQAKGGTGELGANARARPKTASGIHDEGVGTVWGQGRIPPWHGLRNWRSLPAAAGCRENDHGESGAESGILSFDGLKGAFRSQCAIVCAKRILYHFQIQAVKRKNVRMVPTCTNCWTQLQQSRIAFGLAAPRIQVLRSRVKNGEASMTRGSSTWG
jgi:hypothetical protein